MRWLAHTISDDQLCGIIEADFRQFYGADLRDFYRRGSGMTYRWVISHIKQLPTDSRLVKHLRSEDGSVWDQPDHHRQDVVDLLGLVVYYLQISALSGIKKSDRAKVQKGAPARQLRPGEKEVKPKMSSKEDLKRFFSGGGLNG